MPRTRSFFLRPILAASIAAWLAAPAAHAQTFEWRNTATIWDATMESWTNGNPFFQPRAWQPGANGTIVGNYAISVVGTQSVNSLTVSGTTSLSGGTLSINGISIGSTPNPVTINSNLLAGGSGTLTLTTNGGTFYLTSASTLGGALSVTTGGAVVLAGATASLAATTVSVASVTQLILESGATLSASAGPSTIDGSLTLTGANTSAAFNSLFLGGTLTVNAGTTFSNPGATVVSGGLLTLTGQTLTLSTLQARGTGTNVALSGGTALTLTQDVSVGLVNGSNLDTGKIQIGAGSTLDVRSNLNFGTTQACVVEILSGGTLKIGAGGGINSPGGASGRLVMGVGSALVLTGNLTSNAPVVIDSTLGSGAVPRFDTNGFDATISGAFSRPSSGVAIEKRGAGILKLTGNNVYGASVGTILTGGLIEFSTRQNLGIQSSDTTQQRIDFQGGGLRWAPGNTNDISAWIRTVVDGTTATFDTNGNNVTFATGTGYSNSNGTFLKTGAGTLTLTAATNRIGGTTINGGTLAINGRNRIGGGTISVTSGATLALTTSGSFSNTITVDGSGAALTGTNFLEFGSASDSSGGGRTLAVTNGGTVGAATTIAIGNATTGAVTVAGTGSAFTAGTTLFLGSSGGTGTLTVGSGGTATVGTLSFSGALGTLNLNTGGTLRVGGVGGIVQTAGTAALNLAGGTLRVIGADLSTTVPLTLSNASTVDTNALNATLGAQLGGTGSLTKVNPGTLVLNAVNSYSGGTVITGGALRVAAASSLGSGGVIVNGGAQLQAVDNFSSNHSISLDGTSTLLSTAGFIESGIAGGTGSLGVTNGAQVSAGTSVALGVAAGSSGAITASGTGARVDAATIFFLGFAGNGVLTVGSGATAKAGQFIFGSQAGSAGTLTLNSGGALEVGGTSGLMRGAGGATFNLAGGAVRVTGADLTGNVSLALSGSSTLDTNALNATLSGAFSGSGALTKIGAGTLALSGVSSIGGNLVANGGALALTAGSLASGGFVEIGSTGAASLTVSGGAKLSSATSVAFGVQAGISGSAGVTGAGSTLTAPTTLHVGILGSAGVNVGSGGVVNAGQLSLGTLAGGSGTFDLNLGGTLNVGGADGIVKGGGTAVFNLAGGTLKVTGSSLSTSVPLTLANQSLIDTSGVNAIFGGALSGTGGLAKTGAGILYLNAPGSYAGATQIFAGQIIVPAANSLGIGNIGVAGGSLSSSGNFSRDVAITVDGAASSLSAAGFIEIGVGGTGSLAVTNGAQVSTPSSLGFAILPGGTSGSASVTGPGSKLTSGGIMYLGYQGSGTVNVGSGGSVTVGGQIELGSLASGSGTFNLNSGGTLNIGGANGIARGAGAATFNLSGGTLKITGSSLTTSVPIALTNLSLIDTSGVNAVFGGALSGPGGFVKTGAGILYLNVPNTYAAGTALIAGQIVVPAATSLGTGAINVLGGNLHSTNTFARDVAVTVDGAGSSLTAAGAIQIGVGGAGSLSIINGAAVSTPGPLTLAVLDGGTSGAVSVTGVSSTLTVGGALTLGAGLSSTGTLGVGAGGIVRAGSLVFGPGPGDFTLNSGGQLEIGGTNAIVTNGLPPDAFFRLAGGTLKVTGSSLTTSTQVILTNNSQIDTDGLSASLNGVLNGPGGFAKTGAGTLTLGGPSFYTGTTGLLAGTLALGAANVLPDNAPLALAGGTLALGGFSDTTGALILGDSSTIDLTSGVPVAFTLAASGGQPWFGTLTITGFSVGFDALRFGTDASALTVTQLAAFRFADYGNASGAINASGFVTPIPEPGSLALSLTAGLVLLRRRR